VPSSKFAVGSHHVPAAVGGDDAGVYGIVLDLVAPHLHGGAGGDQKLEGDLLGSSPSRRARL